MKSNLLRCPRCNMEMSKIMFLEKQEMFDEDICAWLETGYARWQCNNLTCEHCGHTELVDDYTFAEEWFKL